jgi:O-antigen ligase
LAAGFLRNYYAGVQMDFAARSPHSIWLTILGRIGLIGLLVFAVMAFVLLHEAYLAARRVSRERAPASSLVHWCAVLCLFGAASFGVVLEGPMGGVLFWSFLGLAVSQKATESKPVLREAASKPVPLQHRQSMPRPQLASARLRSL